jgi:two-component system, response regulator FlrC
MSQQTLLVVEDDPGLQEAIVDTLALSGYRCLTANCGEEALIVLQRQKVDMIISDVQMPGMDGLSLLQNVQHLYAQIPMLLMTAFGNIEGAVRAMRDGAVDYLVKPFAPEVLLNQVSRYVPAHQVERHAPVYGDPKTAALLQLAAKVARSDASVMISGPSGTGKEVLARYIHDQSCRSDQPFIAINCAAIPENMLEATLFGYEKGAFTGAIQGCPGKFEQAQGGTLLLDEITEIDPGLQAKLLRVLQEREVERLGSRKTISLDVRVLATTNRDLRKAVANHLFREDLFYRLNVFPLRWLPLRARAGDIMPLAEHLLRRHATAHRLALPDLTMTASHKLLSYQWPGNVRELENVMQRALILAKNNQITADEILFDTEAVYSEDDQLSWNENEESGLDADEVFIDRVPGIEKLGNELRQQEHQIILDTLIACDGSRKAVAERLGISPRTLRYKLARMRDVGIEVPD